MKGKTSVKKTCENVDFTFLFYLGLCLFLFSCVFTSNSILVSLWMTLDLYVCYCTFFEEVESLQAKVEAV